MLKERAIEDPRSVSSPRRILSFSKNRRATVSFLDPDDKISWFGVSGEHGPKPSEVYGFVGSISTVVATDEFSRETLSFIPMTEGDELPKADIDINQINELMFNALR